MAELLSCYVANPDGFAESTKLWYYERLLPMLGRHVTVLDPWAVKVDHIFKAKPADRPRLWLELGEHHLDTIKNKAKLVVAVLDQEPPDNGTVVETAWAAAHNIPVIGYRNDLRNSGEEGMHYNLMIGAAIKRSGGIAVSDIVQLETAVKSFSETGTFQI